MEDGYTSEHSDDDLGMHRAITRRDFLDGFALAAGAAVLARAGAAQASWVQPAYPPGETGLRGSYPDSLRVMDALMQGRLDVRHPRETGERYDLVVVGAGLSGLAAAHFYRRDVDPRARILIIDPHDDFGGHAKRNELAIGDRLLIKNGGSSTMDNVDDWPSQGFAASRQLLDDVGIDLDALARQDIGGADNPYTRFGANGSATMFPKEAWGAAEDHLVVRADIPTTLAGAPLTERAKVQLTRVLTDPPDWLAGMTPERKVAELKQRTCSAVLTEFAPTVPDFGPVEPQVLQYLEPTPLGGTGLPFSLAPALDSLWAGTAGMGGLRQGVDLSRPIPGVRNTAVLRWNAAAPTRTFVDGNAGIARSLVRALIPGSIPGTSTEDLTLTQVDYSKLDRRGSDVRIRLESTVVRVEHEGRRHAEVRYVRDGKLHRVKADHVFFGCWNAMIPFLVPELSRERRAALAEAVKMPMTYLRVGITNWRAWRDMTVNSINFRGGYWTGMSLDAARQIGGYRSVTTPDEPVLVTSSKGHTKGSVPRMQDGAEAGRRELLQTSFAEFERSVRDYLVRALGSHGFDPARDISAITVNRWPYGYMRYYYLPNDAAFWPDGPTPAQIGAAPFGRLTFGTTDAANHGFAEGAMNKAYEAIQHIRWS